MKKIFIIICFIAGCGLSFLFGNWYGYKSHFKNEMSYHQPLSALDAVGSYLVMVDVVKDIKQKELGRAVCGAEVYASAKVLEIRDCLQNSSCKAIIAEQVQKSAPEILKNDNLQIRFFEQNEVCSPS